MENNFKFSFNKAIVSLQEDCSTVTLLGQTEHYQYFTMLDLRSKQTLDYLHDGTFKSIECHFDVQEAFSW